MLVTGVVSGLEALLIAVSVIFQRAVSGCIGAVSALVLILALVIARLQQIPQAVMARG